MIKTRISTILLILVCFLLQTTLLQNIKLAGVVPNLLMIITVCIGYIRGRTEGLIVGFFCGLMFDMVYGSVIGLYAFVFMLIGFLTGYCHKVYYTDNSLIPILLVFLGELIYGDYYFICEFLLRGRTHFFFYFIHIIFPEIVYTVVVSIIVFRFMLFLERIFGHKREVRL